MMAYGSKCVAKNRVHDDLVARIRKSLYFGDNFENQESDVEENLSLPLASYASELFSKSHRGYSLNCLSVYNAAKIQANPCSLIMAVIFLERLNSLDPSYVHRITPQELFIVSMMISTKFYIGYDEEIYISDWAAEGNMTDERLKQLELEFLCAIDWNIYISNQEFFTKLGYIEKILAHRQGLPRGWLTYTELVQLLPAIEETTTMLNAIFNHLAVLLVSYAAGVLTIIGAFFLASNIPGHALHRPLASAKTSTGHLATLGSSSEFNVNSTPIATAVQTNSSCCIINTEAELIKLENQYKQEENRHRNNEIDQHALHLMLPLKLMSQSIEWTSSKKSEHRWLTFKEMYSKESKRFRDMTFCTNNRPSNKTASQCANFEHFTNVTNALQLFWQILADAEYPSFEFI